MSADIASAVEQIKAAGRSEPRVMTRRLRHHGGAIRRSE